MEGKHDQKRQLTAGNGMARWGILALIYLCVLSFAAAFQSIPPIMPLVIDYFRLSHYQAGMLMSIFALPGIFIAVPVGMLADRYGVKPVAIVSLLTNLVGTAVVANAEAFPTMLVGRMIAGTGVLALIIICPHAIAQWFASREIGLAMGVYNTSMPAGSVAALNALPVLAGLWGWRSAIWVSAAMSALTLLLFILFYSSPPGLMTGKRPKGSEGWSIGQVGFPIWLVGAAWGLFNASILSLTSFAPDFMVHVGLPLKSAGFATSLVMVAPLALSALIGFAIDRLGKKEIFIAVGGLAMACLLVLVPWATNHLLILMAAIGVAVSLIPPPVFSLAADVVSRERLGTGYGILSLLNNSGIFVGPQLVGALRDATGSYRLGFWLMALFALLAATAIIFLCMVRRQR